MLVRVPHPRPLIEGHLIDRYDRFIAEIELCGGARGRIRAHCVNPGRMEGQIQPGARVWVWAVDPQSKRKLRYTWELVEEDGRLVGANTTAPNRVIGALLAARVLPGLRRFRALQAEVAYAERSRVDFLLEAARPHYIEVKNAHLRYPDGRAYFPDCVSERASAHLEALQAQLERGAKATVIFAVQRPDVRALRPSALHDPHFAAAARRAAQAGVRFRALTIRPTLDAYEVLGEIPVDLRPYDWGAHEAWRSHKLPRSGWRRDPRR